MIKEFIRFKLTCRIETIDTTNSTITIRIRSARTSITLSFAQAIGDAYIVQHLTSQQACVLGVFYGRSLYNQPTSVEKSSENEKFSLKNNSGKYKIIYQDHRSGQICYIHQKTKEEFIEHPITIAQNDYIISEFDPTQACHIGILAGMSFEKTLKKDQKTGENTLDNLLKRYPKLRIVK